MKVVINVCFGGFGLSQLACEKLIERGWPVVMSAEETNPFGYRYVIDFSDSPSSLRLLGRYNVSCCHHDEIRVDKDFISVIEEIGEEAASAPLAKLKVVEVPDDVDWEIGYYDGKEWVAEKHNTWS